MKYNQAIITNISTLQNKQWYHQRFDGCPFFLHIISEAENADEQRKHHWKFVEKVCFFHHDHADWYIDMGDINRISKDMIAAAEKNPLLSKELIAAWSDDSNAFYAICRKIHEVNVKTLSDHDLFKLYHDYYQKTIKKVTSSSIIDGFALGTDTIIAEMLQAHLKQQKRSSEFTKLFPILTAPTKQSFINEAEVSLLKIALLKKQNKEYTSELKQHQERYFWSKNNYVHANYLDEAYFEGQIKHILDEYKTSADLQDAIHTIETTPLKNKEAKQKLLKELSLYQHLQTLLTISDDFTWWQDERKKATYWYIHYGCVLLEEIGKRKGFSLHHMKYLTGHEVEMLEHTHTFTQELLNQRIADCAFYWTNKEYCCLSGNSLPVLKNIILTEHDYSKITSFKGLCANSGKVIGRVKIIKSATEVGRVEKGDILVAVMTRPDYITGMKKAAAIITNEGGITCHAAIVSREINIPCIIGTKIATEVLKEGMVVEVDANTGVVTIVS